MLKPESSPGISRREALAVGLAASAAGLTEGGCAQPAPSDEPRVRTGSGDGARLPVVYVPHGGGPWPFVDSGIGAPEELDALATYLRSIATFAGRTPEAVLVVSAHWEEPVFTVTSSARPPMLYDYYGFPPESYSITWPAPGAPELAREVSELVGAAGFESRLDPERGFDHGTFVPMKLAFPNADVPTIQLSLRRGLSPAEHLAVGRAIAPLREKGVLIVGSGMSYHNLRAFGPGGRPAAEGFDAWLKETAVLDARARDERLERWTEAPFARRAHPREEHLLPLMVVAGAALQDRGRCAYDGTLLGLRLSGYAFS